MQTISHQPVRHTASTSGYDHALSNPRMIIAILVPSSILDNFVRSRCEVVMPGASQRRVSQQEEQAHQTSHCARALPDDAHPSLCRQMIKFSACYDPGHLRGDGYLRPKVALYTVFSVQFILIFEVPSIKSEGRLSLYCSVLQLVFNIFWK